MSLAEDIVTMPSDLDLALGPELRIFDTQLCASLDLHWLCQAVEGHGVSADEVKSLLDDGLVRTWKSPKAEEGFLLYSERQVRVAKALRAQGSRPLAELRHILDDWNVIIEIHQMEVLAYDSFDISDYEHFRRRTAKDAAFFKSQLDLAETPKAGGMEEEQKERWQNESNRWTKWNQLVSANEDEELSHKNRLGWRHALAHLRWVDEYTRIMDAENFVKLIEDGFSSEVTFNGFSQSADGTEFTHLNWPFTLQRFKDTINEGHNFPLRTPDFSITQSGIVFSSFPTAEHLAALQDKYQLDVLRICLAEWGKRLWDCDLAASGRAECEECQLPFERTKALRRFCSSTCRNRAKQRRWRENNPEKADAARARYYE